MTDTCGCCSEELGATEMRDLLLENVKALTADLEKYKGLLKEAQGERDAARESIDFMRNRWSMFGGRGCALCVYVDGKYVRACKLHEYLSAVSGQVDELQHERDAALAEVERMRKYVEHNDEEYRTMKEVLRAEHEACQRMRLVHEAAVAWGLTESEVAKHVGLDTPAAIKARQDEWRATDVLRDAIDTATTKRGSHGG